jgi:hypothetical protein
MSTVAMGPVWGAVCSDDTGNTHVGREEICAKWKWMFNLFDCVHHLHNSTKNITGLDVFKQVCPSLFVDAHTYLFVDAEHHEQYHHTFLPFIP